jgi:hypothetical protein
MQSARGYESAAMHDLSAFDTAAPGYPDGLLTLSASVGGLARRIGMRAAALSPGAPA